MVQTSPWKDVLHAGTPPPLPPALFAFAVAFQGLAIYLVLETNFTVLRVFKKRGSLYFWSLLLSSWGVLLHTLGYILQWWTPASPWILNTACILMGWSMMVTCQSLVLYSRLHLVVRNHTVLRAVLGLIVTTAIVVEIPQWVTTWGACDTTYAITKKWSPYDSIMVRISQLAFFIQETLLSCLYIWGTAKILAPNDKINVKRIKYDLIYINIYIVVVDLIIMVLAYTNEHFPKEPTQNFAYAFKLKLEFVVLNQLVAVTHRASSSYLNNGGRYAKGSSGNANGNGIGGPGGLERSKYSNDLVKNDYSLNALAYANGPVSPLGSKEERSGSDLSGKTAADVKAPESVFADVDNIVVTRDVKVRSTSQNRFSGGVRKGNVTSAFENGSTEVLKPVEDARPRSGRNWGRVLRREE